MIELVLVGIGTGHPEHLTLQGIRALQEADLLLIPLKSDDKSDLAALRLELAARHAPKVPVALAPLPLRDEGGGYLAGVGQWHDAISRAWQEAVAAHLPGSGGRVALMVWGDPSLYDSSLRIAGRLQWPARVVPGVTAMQALCAAHAIPLNSLGNPVTITTGRRLREGGWPLGADRVLVMLDGGCAFTTLAPENLQIWWGAFLGMPDEVLVSGPLAEAGPRIAALRAEARAAHGWIMDCYLLARTGQAPDMHNPCTERAPTTHGPLSRR